MSWAILVATLPFALLAGILAFVITYEEYSHHHLGARTVAQHALRTGVVALAFFVLLALGLSVILPLVVNVGAGFAQ